MSYFKYCFSVLLTLAFTHSLYAVPPRTEDKDFSGIVAKDPFAPLVVKKAVVQQVAPKPEVPKEDWILKSYSKDVDGWMIQIASKKTPTKNIILEEHVENKEIPKLISVTDHESDYTLTKAKIRTTSGVVQIVEFDKAISQKLLTQATPRANPSPGARPTSGAVNSSLPSKRPSTSPKGSGSSEPRRRIIVPSRSKSNAK